MLKLTCSYKIRGECLRCVPLQSFVINIQVFITLPVLHKTDLETRENVPYLLINLSVEDEEIKKGEEMATMQLYPYQLQEIAKEKSIKQNDKEQTTEEEIKFHR